MKATTAQLVAQNDRIIALLEELVRVNGGRLHRPPQPPVTREQMKDLISVVRRGPARARSMGWQLDPTIWGRAARGVLAPAGSRRSLHEEEDPVGTDMSWPARYSEHGGVSLPLERGDRFV